MVNVGKYTIHCVSGVVFFVSSFKKSNVSPFICWSSTMRGLFWVGMQQKTQVESSTWGIYFNGRGGISSCCVYKKKCAELHPQKAYQDLGRTSTYLEEIQVYAVILCQRVIFTTSKRWLDFWHTHTIHEFSHAGFWWYQITEEKSRVGWPRWTLVDLVNAGFTIRKFVP